MIICKCKCGIQHPVDIKGDINIKNNTIFYVKCPGCGYNNVYTKLIEMKRNENILSIEVFYE